MGKQADELLGKTVSISIKTEKRLWKCKGIVIHYIPAKQLPTFDELTKYFEVSPNSNIFKFLAQSSSNVDRIVVCKDNKRHAVIPLTSKLQIY